MAVMPLSGTNVRVLSGVPFTKSYQDTRWFDSLSQQTSWFLGRNVIHSMEDSNYKKTDDGVAISVNASYESLLNATYVMYQNEAYSNKWFYAFVNRIEYVQRNMTRLWIQLDVIQTWMFDITFKPSFVVREHCPLWNADGSPVINTVDEGLDYGSIMETVSIDSWLPYDDIYFMVVVAKQGMHSSLGGTGYEGKVISTTNSMPQPLVFYVHPFRLATGDSPTVMVGGQNAGISRLDDVLESLYKSEDAVNNIVSIYITEHIGCTPSYDGTTMTFDASNFEVARIDNPDSSTNISTLWASAIDIYTTSNKNFGNKYEGYRTVKESKLLMYPYTSLILDDLKGNRVELKNEFINNNNLLITAKGSLGTSNKVAYSIQNYGNRGLEDSSERSRATMESALINNNPNDIPILTDMLSAYLQGNRNSLEVQKSSIQFNGIMNAVGGAVGLAASAASRDLGGAVNSGLGIVQGAGNAVLDLQGIQAKQQDINNQPPNLAKQGSNSYFDYGNRLTGLQIIKKQLTPEYQKKLEDFFNMYGYKKNEVKIPNFHTRRYWNYVQTNSCKINADLNHADLQEIRNVFNNGITLWHTDDIGNYSLNNTVL